MPTKSRQNPEYLALQRSQLDARKDLGSLGERPHDGWVRTVRSALGMSAAQLARRLGVTQQAVANLERNERRGAVSLATLAKVAESLDCDLVIAFAPKTTLEDTVRRQAMTKARAERDRVVHTMRLEAQEEGVEQVFDLENDVRQWMTTRIARLWD